MKNFDLSIIVVSWNAKALLRDCLRSIYRTTKRFTFEIIVVDNNSSDGSQKMVKTEFTKVKLIPIETNLGFAKANNIGIKAASGRYLCLVNSDVKLLQDCIDLMISYMNRNPQIGMLGPKVFNIDMTLQPNFRNFPSLLKCFCRALALDKIFPESKLFDGTMMNFFHGNIIRTVDVLTGVFWLLRREALAKVGLLDERFFIYAEDIDWCKRFNMAGWDIVYYPDAKVIHYGGGSSSNAPIAFYIEMQRAYLQYWQKHYNRYHQICFASIMLLHHIFRVVGWTLSTIIDPREKSDKLHKIDRSITYVTRLLRLSSNRDKVL